MNVPAATSPAHLPGAPGQQTRKDHTHRSVGVKTSRRDGTTHSAISPLALAQWMAELVQRPRLHPPMTASRLSIRAVGWPVRVDSCPAIWWIQSPGAGVHVDGARQRSVVADPRQRSQRTVANGSIPTGQRRRPIAADACGKPLEQQLPCGTGSRSPCGRADTWRVRRT